MQFIMQIKANNSLILKTSSNANKEKKNTPKVAKAKGKYPSRANDRVELESSTLSLAKTSSKTIELKTSSNTKK